MKILLISLFAILFFVVDGSAQSSDLTWSELKQTQAADRLQMEKMQKETLASLKELQQTQLEKMLTTSPSASQMITLAQELKTERTEFARIHADERSKLAQTQADERKAFLQNKPSAKP